MLCNLSGYFYTHFLSFILMNFPLLHQSSLPDVISFVSGKKFYLLQFVAVHEITSVCFDIEELYTFGNECRMDGFHIRLGVDAPAHCHTDVAHTGDVSEDGLHHVGVIFNAGQPFHLHSNQLLVH